VFGYPGETLALVVDKLPEMINYLKRKSSPNCCNSSNNTEIFKNKIFF